MSALGQKQTSEDVKAMSALPLKADIAECDWDVRFWHKADIPALHSMISSARADSVGGTSIWSALAVLRLMTNSNFVDCTIGK